MMLMAVEVVGPEIAEFGLVFEEVSDRRFRNPRFLRSGKTPVGRPTGNAVVERLIRTLKEEVIWLLSGDQPG